MLKAVFFDLDGTLLPINEDEFMKLYFGLLAKKVAPLGYESKKLIETILEGTKRMYQNDGTKTNEEVFWNYFCEVFGSDSLKDIDVFNSFYTNEFKQTIKACQENKLAKEIINFCNLNLEKVILATNPLFPNVGTYTRMSFIDLCKDDFDFITTYENCSFTKPNPKYFQFLLDKFNLKSDEVIMFGNNDYEDFIASKKVGIDCYLVGDTLIINKELNINAPKIKMEEVIDVIIKEIAKRNK